MSDRKKLKVTEKLIQEINSKLDMKEVLAYFGVKSKGGFYYCPWCQAQPHHKHNPKLVINDDNTWQCLDSCGNGTPLEFIRKFDNIAIDTALILAASIAKIPIEDINDHNLAFSHFSDEEMSHEKLEYSLMDAPNNKGLYIPDGWVLSEDGIFIKSISKQGEKVENLIAYAPAFISGKFTNIDTDEQLLRITFLNDEQWQDLIVDRVKVLDHRKIVNLAKTGFPVNSLNSIPFVKYFIEFEAMNRRNMEKQLTVSEFGWKEYNKEKFFVIGNKVVGANINVLYEPSGAADEKYSRALLPEGTMEGWLNTTRKVLPYPRAMFALYAAFVPPILELLNANSFIIDFSGLTSTGKTTAIEIPASVWGMPTASQGGLVLPWDASKVSLERLATLFNHLPIFLDDSQTTSDNVISKSIYMLANGTGKIRATSTGRQKTNNWRTVCFSTGERPITHVTEFAGVKSRVIEIFGTPFDGLNANLVHEIKDGIYSNYGHAAIPFIEHITKILTDKTKYDELITRHREKTLALSAKAESKENVIGRVSHYFAAVELAGELAEEVLKIGGIPGDIVNRIFEEVYSISDEKDDSDKLLNLITSWVKGNLSNFDSNLPEAPELEADIYGVIRDNDYLAIMPKVLKELLNKNGFNYNSALKLFNSKGWIFANGEHLTYPIQVRGAKNRMVKFDWKSISKYFNTEVMKALIEQLKQIKAMPEETVIQVQEEKTSVVPEAINNYSVEALKTDKTAGKRGRKPKETVAEKPVEPDDIDEKQPPEITNKSRDLGFLKPKHYFKKKPLN